LKIAGEEDKSTEAYHRQGKPDDAVKWLARSSASKVLGRLLQFLLNFKIDIADSDPVSVKLAVNEELKDSRPAINDFDCGVFLFLEAF